MRQDDYKIVLTMLRWRLRWTCSRCKHCADKKGAAGDASSRAPAANRSSGLSKLTTSRLPHLATPPIAPSHDCSSLDGVLGNQRQTPKSERPLPPPQCRHQSPNSSWPKSPRLRQPLMGSITRTTLRSRAHKTLSSGSSGSGA